MYMYSSSVRRQDNRLRGLAYLALEDGEEVEGRGAVLGAQFALQGLRESANARSAHFLRSRLYISVQIRTDQIIR